MFFNYYTIFPNVCILFDFIFGEVVGIFHAMDNFTGRKKSGISSAQAC